MSIAAAAWCVVCGGPPELAVSFERNGVMAHYGTCRRHVVEVAKRAAADLEERHVARALEVAKQVKLERP